MTVTVKGKQVDVGDALRTYVDDNLGEAVAKYFSPANEGQVVFSRDAHLFTVDILVHVDRGLELQSHGAAEEAYPAFDQALDKLTRQLQRYKARIADHHRKQKSEQAHDSALAYVLKPMQEDAEAVSDKPAIIAEMETRIESLSVSEAVMRMDLADQNALLFKNSSSGQINMVYRRRDGNIGWIDSSNTKNNG